jgi:hypothetical protein
MTAHPTARLRSAFGNITLMKTSLPPPITPPQPPQSTTLAHQAAKGSWHSVVIVFVLGVFSRPARAEVAFESISFFVMVVGLVLGVIALFGIRKHGRKGILTPAIVGIVLNALLLSFSSPIFWRREPKHSRSLVVELSRRSVIP